LVFDDDSVLIINSFRSHAIPFAVVDDVSTGSTVTIRAAGKTYTSWGAPFPPSARAAGSQRSGAIGPATVTPWDRPGSAVQRQGLEQHPLVHAWTRSRPDRTPSVPPGEAAAVTRWNKSTLVLALLCGLLIAGQQLMLFLFQT
jgi:hypothetical protein